MKRLRCSGKRFRMRLWMRGMKMPLRFGISSSSFIPPEVKMDGNKKFNFSMVSDWLGGGGQFSEIILSSRIRINRNLKNRKFVSWSSNQELQELAENLLEVISIINYFKNSYQVQLGINKEPAHDLFPERFICNYKYINEEIPRGIVIGENEDLSILINNYDHLNIQAYQSGLNLDDLFLLISKVQDEFEANLNFSYSQ
ncbi:MAG TPA: hypothetical protein ENN73_03735, partial [Firmicutes bacterium]|nr:hypothetical protein [Bacillota bacterium]